MMADWAKSKDYKILFKRVQVSELLFGKNLYYKGIYHSSKILEEEIESTKREYPTLKYISFIGSSYGALITR